MIRPAPKLPNAATQRRDHLRVTAIVGALGLLLVASGLALWGFSDLDIDLRVMLTAAFVAWGIAAVLLGARHALAAWDLHPRPRPQSPTDSDPPRPPDDPA